MSSSTAGLAFAQAPLPKSEIYWWIDAGLAPLLEDDPDLSGLLIFDQKNGAGPCTGLNCGAV